MKKTTTKKKNNPIKIVAPSVAALSGLAGGLHSVKDIAAATKMSEKQTMGAIASLCRRGLCEKRKTGSYWITKEGRAKLRAEKKALKK